MIKTQYVITDIFTEARKFEKFQAKNILSWMKAFFWGGNIKKIREINTVWFHEFFGMPFFKFFEQTSQSCQKVSNVIWDIKIIYPNYIFQNCSK